MKFLLCAITLVAFFGIDSAEAGKKKKKYKVTCAKNYSLVDLGKNKFVCRKMRKKGKEGRVYKIDCGNSMQWKHEHLVGKDKCENTNTGEQSYKPMEKCYTGINNVGTLELVIDHTGKEDKCVEKVKDEGYKYKKPKFKKV